MSNYEWHRDQEAGEIAMRAVNEVAAQRDELRDLLSAFIDASVLKGFVVTKEQWERACLLCGRWCPPFVERQLKPSDSKE